MCYYLLSGIVCCPLVSVVVRCVSFFFVCALCVGRCLLFVVCCLALRFARWLLFVARCKDSVFVIVVCCLLLFFWVC